jgi:acetyl-CoA C-acetyltransferase
MAVPVRSAIPSAPPAPACVTLLHALEAHHLKRGVAALCIGGGEATAIAVERISY